MITVFFGGFIVGMGFANLAWIAIYNPDPKLALALLVAQTVTLIFVLVTGRIRAWMENQKGFKP